MQKVWKVKPRVKTDLIEQLLENRGITGERETADFLHPEYEKLHDPFLFNEMPTAVERIWQAIEKKEKILIYSDYDADAITANAVLFRTFKFLGIEVETYIPDRFSEGYGLNLEAFEKIKERQVRLVITVDCGTNSVAEAQFCKANGIDLIITDHHELTGGRPEALAIINPKLPGEKYPYREITGVGVAFKLACAILSAKAGRNSAAAAELPAGFEKWLLDLVAIGTVADCHSLLGENRILVKFGLKVLAKTKWPGLRALLASSGLESKATDAELDTYSLGFIIAPRINAAGRIEHASIAFDLLVCENQEQAALLAAQLEALNSKRQTITETVMSEARSQLLLISERKVLLAVGSDWPKGVVGLVAGKLVEEFARPVLVLEKGRVECTGSARSHGGFNLVEALKYSESCLVRYGGHAAAAGFTLKTEHIDVFYKNLLDYAENNVSEENPGRIIEVDAELKSDEVNMQNLEAIESFEPFGVDNLRPRFMLKDLELVDLTAVGKERKHLQLTVAKDGKVFKCIAFNFGWAAENLRQAGKIDLVFELLVDAWNGVRNLKFRVIDFRKAENV